MYRLVLAYTAMFVAIAIAAPAIAQDPPYDHLVCHKVKTAKAFKKASVDLEALIAAYGLQGCALKPKAKLFCTPVRKTVTSIENGTPLAVDGETDATQSLCYSVKCPKTVLPDGTFSDQFGVHALSKLKPKMLCAPAVQGTVTTTTTTTTTQPCVPSGGEVCNLIDDDCNGTVDDGLGSSTCGVGACQNSVQNCTNGVPGVCVPGLPAMTETCGNAIDDTCDGQVDEGCP